MSRTRLCTGHPGSGWHCFPAAPSLTQTFPCQQVAELILRGHATHRVAHRLEISPYTAQEHLRHIFAKVGIASRRELVAALILERSE